MTNGQMKLSSEEVHLQTPMPEDFVALRAMGRQSFSDAFSHLYDSEPFADFLDKTYGVGGSLERATADPTVTWKVAVARGLIVGYAKLLPLVAPAPSPLPSALELQQIYVLAEWHGRGVAQQLMNWALGVAVGRGAPEIYLTVFDHNERAKKFYSRNGFSEVGHCTFKLGDRVDDDRIWRKTL